VTAPFTYVRWLGRREDIPDDDFSQVRIDRDAQLDAWADQDRRIPARRDHRSRLLQQPLPGALPASVRALQLRLSALDLPATDRAPRPRCGRVRSVLESPAASPPASRRSEPHVDRPYWDQFFGADIGVVDPDTDHIIGYEEERQAVS